MPIYVYRCADCSHEFERLQRTDDLPLTVCPECGSKTIHKVISPCGIIFKGSGFYKTDNPSSSTGSGHHHSEHESSETSEKHEASHEVAHQASSSESKTEAKPESASGSSAKAGAAKTSSAEGK